MVLVEEDEVTKKKMEKAKDEVVSEVVKEEDSFLLEEGDWGEVWSGIWRMRAEEDGDEVWGRKKRQLRKEE